MIQIKPEIQHQSTCPNCKTQLVPEKTLWQGIHVCAVSLCSVCKAEIIDDMKVGHALFAPCQIDMKAKRLFINDANSISWYGNPFLQSLINPKYDSEIKLSVEKFFDYKRIVILNCIDFLYGHSLLKLLNAETYLSTNQEIGLIVLIPLFLRWMIPPGVAEVWTINIPLSKAQNYYPHTDQLIKKEFNRFDEIYISYAHSHPKKINITNFTGIQRHDFCGEKFRISFIWREDRLWFSNVLWVRFARKIHFVWLLCLLQNLKILRFFSLLRIAFPRAVFTVAGLGTSTRFPAWIDDQRVDYFDDDKERQVCKIYSESRLVMGVHGSNMLLPSAHAGMTIVLMPIDRWGNFAEDVIYQECDNRLSSYKYRYLPLNINVRLLAYIASLQIKWYQCFKKQMMNELP